MSRTFQSLLADLRRGDAAAGQILFDEYGGLLLQVIRGYLNPAIRRQVDSVDFVQDVWLAFLVKPDGTMSFDSPEQLAGFLATVARNKVIDAVRHSLRSAGHTLNREVRIEEKPGLEDKLIGRGTTASHVAMTKELDGYLLEGFRPVHQKIARQVLEGRDAKSIAEELDISIRTVMRIRERILKRLEEL